MPSTTVSLETDLRHHVQRRSLKILQVLCGGAWGGGSVVVLAITRALLARGDRVWVVCTDDENARRFRRAGATVVRPRFWYRPISPMDVFPLLQLTGLCRKEKFDLVATHTSKGGFIGRLAGRLAGAPRIVHHAHGFAFNKVLRPAVFRFFVALEWLAARAGDFIISVNNQHREMAIRLGVTAPEGIFTVHNGIDPRPYVGVDREAARRRLGFDDSVLLVGSVGRLAPQKGFVYLVRALPLLIPSVPSVRLLIAGDGPLREELEREAHRTGYGDRVHFLGFRNDIPELLAAFDIFALPSLWEGLSISLLEAQAAGKPILTTDIDANREVIDPGETGWLVPPADPAALASALQDLASDAELARRLGANARQAALTRFSEERMVEQNLAVYDRIIAGSVSDRTPA